MDDWLGVDGKSFRSAYSWLVWRVQLLLLRYSLTVLTSAAELSSTKYLRIVDERKDASHMGLLRQ